MRYGMATLLALAVAGGLWLGTRPPPGLLEGLGALLLLALAWRRPLVWLPLAALAWVAAGLLLARGAILPDGLLREDLAIEGQLISVSREERLTRLTLEVSDCHPLAAGRPGCERLQRVRLSAFEAPAMHPGERWALTVRLRPPAGFANPHTFDYEAWLWREGIQATGYMRREPPPRRLAEARPGLREHALSHLETRGLPPRAERWLAALTLGAGERLTADDWGLLNASGTTHLMVISGLHVGLVAGFTLLLGRGAARLITPSGWRLAVWPWWLAGAAAAGYAGLSGLEPPALRALVMTLVGLWVASGRHAPGPWQGWWLALAVVLLLDPRHAWRPGLWLSFLAVALLILAWQGRPRPRGLHGWAWALVRTQLLLAPLMAAAVLLAFARLAPAAPLVNLVAVPLVSSLLVPLGLLGWLLVPLPPLSALCWWLFARLAEALAWSLERAVALLPLWLPEPHLVTPLAFCLGVMALLWVLPGLAGSLRAAGSLALIAVALSLSPSGIPHGQLEVRVLDVGQGQLVELRTAGYRALYDTGPRFISGFAPVSTLWPPGQRFDEVIVSHDDIDHAGGVPLLAEAHRVGRFLAPPGEEIGVSFEYCLQGQAWERDGVRFRFLWPPADTAALSSNDRSCVLEVNAGGERLLITGDVGRRVERSVLLEAEAPVTLLVAGHHGSHTSSGPQLVQWLTPRHVVYSAGRHNAFGHPHAEVVRRFRAADSCQWSTALDGALAFRLGDEGAVPVERRRRLPWRRGGVGGDCLALESP
ncbi:DNA internalization-related competence protein ComEC/Rec2 [Halomonas mongoliensis]|uniref:DNA internalization-related competence protein ComEC/Rec2 n=1 Tax=Halomonas mongoliensis TaxID=321265 RepID=A0ABU1GJB8_9GAMM|nr:DNA internalization-related competence protein ComEC/Rec2 [Halomonas mongoliensis]MDR5891692.1 DNA internalization-related competence protein ComEC/Rec2 [Halomonas mongoliensis]